jgi:hypothetical protein
VTTIADGLPLAARRPVCTRPHRGFRRKRAQIDLQVERPGSVGWCGGGSEGKAGLAEERVDEVGAALDGTEPTADQGLELVEGGGGAVARPGHPLTTPTSVQYRPTRRSVNAEIWSAAAARSRRWCHTQARASGPGLDLLDDYQRLGRGRVDVGPVGRPARRLPCPARTGVVDRPRRCHRARPSDGPLTRPVTCIVSQRGTVPAVDAGPRPSADTATGGRLPPGCLRTNEGSRFTAERVARTRDIEENVVVAIGGRCVDVERSPV